MPRVNSLAGTTLIAALVGVAAACQSHDTTVPVIQFVVSPSTAFAGSTVLIRGTDFRTRGTGAIVTVSDSDVPLIRIDDTTMSARLPVSAAGVLTPVLTLDGDRIPLTAITVFGFADMQAFNQQPYEASVWPRTGHAVVMGLSVDLRNLLLFDLDAKSVTRDSAIHIGPHRPGPSYQDSVFLLRSAGDTLEAWRLLPVPSRVAAYPGVGNGMDWEAMQLGPNQWLTSNKYDISTPAGGVAIVQPQGVYISPRHDRATVSALDASGGPSLGTPLAAIPVFAVPSGAVAYLSPLKAVMGVDFSPDGELLAMVGGSLYISSIKRVVLLRASTGEVLGDTTIDRNVYAVALDPVRPLLYVGTVTANRPTLLVLDRSTFRVLGEMQAPAFTFGQSDLATTIQGSVIALNSQNGLYLFWNGNAWRFTLPEP